MLEAFAVCFRCRSARSVDCHEVLSRARPPGAELLADLVTPLCRACHDLVTRGGDAAWLLPSNTSDDDARENVASLRVGA